MKNILLITIISLGILAGCGSSGDGDTVNDQNISQERNSTEYVEDYSEILKYNYNADNSAIQELLPLHVNRYAEVQTKLEDLRGEDEQFSNYYDWYVGDLISSQRAIDTHPSYAPRGKSKSLIVDVINGKIDYTAYKLIGDIDENGEVDFDDETLLKETIENGNMDSQSDLNGDNKVDTKDILEFIARLGTEIKSFDFYTTSGKRLNIPSRDFDDSRSFNYSGNEKKIMVVAKDTNGVSGFTSGLSDIGTLWYVGLSTKKQQKIMHKEEGMEATNPDRIKFVKEALKAIEQEPTPYLLGWSVLVKFTTLDRSYLELDSNGILDMDTFFFKPFEDKIDAHFNKTNMGEPKLPRVLKKDKYFYKRGSTQEDITVTVKAYNAVIKRTDNINGRQIISKSYAYACSIIFTSKENKKLEGEIKKDGKEVKGGIVKAKRIGPDPKEKKYEGKIENSKYKLNDIPFGGYELKYISKCECETILDSNYIFKKEQNKDFSVDKKEVKVKLTIRDENNNLLEDKNVRIEPDECMVEKESFSDISDHNAKVEFNKVPIGKYKVFVDNQESKTIQVCDEFDGDALGEQLWDIEMTFSSQAYSNEQNDWNIPPKEWHWKKVKFAKPTDEAYTFEKAREIFNQGEFYFPYILANPKVDSQLILGQTDRKVSYQPYNRGQVGVGLHYINNHYVIEAIDSIQEYYIDKELFPEWIEIDSIGMHILQGYWGLNNGSSGTIIGTRLNFSQINNLKKHEEFIFSGISEWSNLKGASHLNIVFTPAK